MTRPSAFVFVVAVQAFDDAGLAAVPVEQDLRIVIFGPDRRVLKAMPVRRTANIGARFGNAGGPVSLTPHIPNGEERRMTKKPPVPPASRNPNGPGGEAGSPGKISREEARRANRVDNPKEQGTAGNIAQNTHNQGYQQDR